MICPHCGTANPERAKYCMNCGNPLMIVCSNCGTSNPPVARFCIACGNKLIASALSGTESSGSASTNTQNQDANLESRLQPDERGNDARPTPSNGRDPGPFPPGNDAWHRLVSPAINTGLDGDRRVVTILFCDVKGSTALAEALDPEEWAEIMNEAFGYLIRPVYQYEGTVARLMGDGILAFFGAPIAHEDDPQRAILAALEIISGIHDFHDKVKRQRGMDFDVRIGIHTGLVVVGEIGNDQAMEYTAMGDAVNLAARIQSTAASGSVLITEDTYRLAASLFEVEALGEVEVRGKRQHVQTFRVLGMKDRPTRLRDIASLSSPLVGRGRELGLLRGALADVKEGRGGIVCLIGEAGLGKSRLIEEVHREWFEADKNEQDPQSPTVHTGVKASAGPGIWRESRVISYTAAQPYAAFQSLIRDLCGVSGVDSASTIKDKIACGCLPDPTPTPSCLRIGRAFEVLLGIQTHSDYAPLEGEAFKRELFDAMRLTWEDWSRVSPAVLVFDDLQWADPASIELLLHLFELVSRAPVLFLCAFRPDRISPVWDIKEAASLTYPERYTEILLAPLTEVESGQLVDRLLSSGLPEDLRGMILERAEGNPFFVEEVVRSLVESGVVVHEPGDCPEPCPEHSRRDSSPGRWQVHHQAGEISIPDNLQNLVMARIDRLDEAARHTLQVAAVIGRTFNRRVLERAIGGRVQMESRLSLTKPSPGKIDAQIRALEESDLILETAQSPEVEYTFRHALTHETVYRSILLKRRRLFHHQVGKALETLYPDRGDEYASLLAHHYHEAGDPKAIGYYVQAAEVAFRLYANAEAIGHATQALELAQKYPEVEIPVERIYLLRGRALELSTRYRQALSNYAELEALARDRDDRQVIMSALAARAALLANPTPVQDAAMARQLCERALDLAWELNNQTAAAKIMWTLLLVHVRSGRPEEAVFYGERALSLARDLNLRELLGYTLNDISQAYLALGQIHRGRQGLLEAMDIWRELDNLPMLADSLATAAIFDYLLGEYARSIQESEEAIEIGRQIANLWSQAYARLYLGNVYHELGDTGQAIRVMEECLQLAEKAQFMAPLVNTRAELGKIYASMGMPERGAELVRQAMEVAGQYTPPWFPWVFTDQAQIAILLGDFNAAEAELEKSQLAIQKADPIGLTAAIIPLVKSQLALARGDYEGVLSLTGELESHRKSGIRTFLPDLDYRKGRALFALGRIDEAYNTLSAALQDAESLGSRRVMWPVLKALGDVERVRGNLDVASRYWHRSAETVEYIVNHITGEELKQAFLNLSDVREVYTAVASIHEKS